MERARNVAILIFDQVEVLDFCGPFEVFTVAGKEGADFCVYTVAERAEPVTTIGNLIIQPHYTIDDCPDPDILLVPGGMGTRTEMHNQPLLNWIVRISEHLELLLSVCTGSLMLARANLLGGLRITTHHRAFDLLREAAPVDAVIDENARYIDNGKVVLSAGISAGLDMSLYVVSRLLGEDRAEETAKRMEYVWNKM